MNPALKNKLVRPVVFLIIFLLIIGAYLMVMRLNRVSGSTRTAYQLEPKEEASLRLLVKEGDAESARRLFMHHFFFRESHAELEEALSLLELAEDNRWEWASGQDRERLKSMIDALHPPVTGDSGPGNEKE